MKKNPKPNMVGIDRYWKKGEDDRVILAKKLSMDPGEAGTRGLVDKFLSALWKTISTRRRTKFVGFGVFEWKPWRNRIPTGEFVETWRLSFKPGRYVKEKYHG